MTERGGPGKIRSYWEDDTYIVKRHKGEDSPVFEVVPENGKDSTRVLHRNMLPCDFLPLTSTESVTSAQTKKTHRNTNRQTHVTRQTEQTDTDEDSDEGMSGVTITWRYPETHSLQTLNPAAQECPTEEKGFPGAK